MAQNDIIARRYAKGLAECAGEAGRLQEAREDIRALAAVLDPASGESHVPEFRDFLDSPVVTPAEKLAAAENIMDQMGIGDITADFVKVLLKHGRVGLLPLIVREFRDICGPLTGEYTAVVHTARLLTADQADRLAEALSEAFGGTVRLHQRVDASLLAGVKITVGDRTLDGTVAGRLAELKERLLRTGEFETGADAVETAAVSTGSTG